MKRKGFTLIELLAVIVILAIIALIATPIVLNIISDTRESATIRSAENYISAVEQAVAAKQLDGHAFNPDTCTTLDNGNLLCGEETLEVSFSGSKPSSGASIKFNKGSVVGISNFKIDDKDVLASTLGLKNIITTIIYRWSGNNISIGDIIDPSNYTTDPAVLNENYYLKHVLNEDNEVTESYACARFNNNVEYCARGGSNYYNAKIIKDIQTADPTYHCGFSESSSYCSGDSIALDVFSNGDLSANNPYGECLVHAEGNSSCGRY